MVGPTSNWAWVCVDIAVGARSTSVWTCTGVGATVTCRASGAAVLAGAGMVVVAVVVVACCTSTTRLDSSGASTVSDEVLKATIAFCMPSGKGPDPDSAIAPYGGALHQPFLPCSCHLLSVRVTWLWVGLACERYTKAMSLNWE